MTSLDSVYLERFNSYIRHAVPPLKEHLQNALLGVSGVCWVTSRGKSIDSFLRKANRKTDSGQSKYDEPLRQIHDQLGGLVVVRFLSDVAEVENRVTEYYGHIERLTIEPELANAFGYVGNHYTLFVPTELKPTDGNKNYPEFFELQIKTLFQYAWSETNHAIGYKEEDRLTPDQQRSLAFVAAQAWGADKELDELHQQVKQTGAS
jgi:ppGpp synthetase/RelA/SpoT-type nucleotidyltranferase